MSSGYVKEEEPLGLLEGDVLWKTTPSDDGEGGFGSQEKEVLLSQLGNRRNEGIGDRDGGDEPEKEFMIYDGHEGADEDEGSWIDRVSL